MTKKITQIDAGYFVAGLVWNQRYVTHAAPIIKYMIGWNAEQVSGYVSKKGWKILEDEE